MANASCTATAARHCTVSSRNACSYWRKHESTGSATDWRLIASSSLHRCNQLPERSCSPAVGCGAEPSLPGTGRVLLREPLSSQLVAVQPSGECNLDDLARRRPWCWCRYALGPALLNDRAAQNHRAGARRSAQSLRVDVHGGLTTVSASRSFLAAAPPDPSSCARRGRWASADAAGPLHDPTGRAGLDCSSSKSKSARSAVTPGVSEVERAPAAGLHGTCMSTTRCLAMWLS